ncbi:putative apoptosis-antagonizing transcription factor, AATF leucine zipper-containing [Rosa chinensis]|uniref:Putative apoptosis-antagonizing transcription factor, AATF leucine zipper-containing n=1 Tax=Rosa chinensis TaxID=74649 RepID=A0A2P6SF58_ROSCH|nr:protein AATF [Rosa chinensis]PRQ57314.1 putative apoptosis-antagonizing transcription factor, AATF leucine zipper-containing [Rosa chinensis]
MGKPSKRSRKAPESDSDFEDGGDLDSHELNMEEEEDEFEDEEDEKSGNEEESGSGEEEDEEEGEEENGNKDAEMEELEKQYMDIRHEEQDILKNLKHHKGEDLLKGQALKNQKAIWDKTLEFRFLLQKAFSSSNRLPQEPVRSLFCGSHEDVNAAYSDLVTSSKKTLNSLLELQEALVEKSPSITQDATTGNSGRSKHSEPSKNIGVDGDEDWSRISNWLSRIATFRNKEIDKWQTRAQVNTGAASIKGRLQAFNQSISQQVAAYMRDPSRMVKQMQMRRSAVGVFGTVLKGEDTPKGEESQSDAAEQADGDPELLDDSEFYQQLLKEFFETIDPTSSETAFYSLKKMQSKKRKIVDRRASKSRKIRYNVHEKIVNFMAPEPRVLPPMFPDLTCLFGMKNSKPASVVR